MNNKKQKIQNKYSAAECLDLIAMLYKNNPVFKNHINNLAVTYTEEFFKKPLEPFSKMPNYKEIERALKALHKVGFIAGAIHGIAQIELSRRFIK